MIDDDIDNVPKINKRGEVATALNYRSARRMRDDRDRALYEWFASTPTVIVDALFDHIEGKTMPPDLVRLGGPYILLLREIMWP